MCFEIFTTQNVSKKPSSKYTQLQYIIEEKSEGKLYKYKIQVNAEKPK